MEHPFPRQLDLLNLLFKGAFIFYRPVAGKQHMYEYVMDGKRFNLHGGTVRGLLTRKLIEMKKITAGQMLILTAGGKQIAKVAGESNE